MKKDDHYLTGSLLKTTGNKGELILKFNNDLSEEIQKLESIFIEVDGKLVPFFIEKIKIKSTQTIVVKIEGLNDESKSSEFVGYDFYFSEQQKDDFDVETEEFVDVQGYQVKDQNDEVIGEVIEYLQIKENPLLNLKTEKGEVLIPANDELIIEVDDDQKIIYIEIPNGLFDIS